MSLLVARVVCVCTCFLNVPCRALSPPCTSPYCMYHCAADALCTRRVDTQLIGLSVCSYRSLKPSLRRKTRPQTLTLNLYCVVFLNQIPAGVKAGARGAGRRQEAGRFSSSFMCSFSRRSSSSANDVTPSIAPGPLSSNHSRRHCDVPLRSVTSGHINPATS